MSPARNPEEHLRRLLNEHADGRHLTQEEHEDARLMLMSLVLVLAQAVTHLRASVEAAEAKAERAVKDAVAAAEAARDAAAEAVHEAVQAAMASVSPRAQAKRVLAGLAVVGAVLAPFGGAAWWLVSPRVEPLLSVPERLAAMERGMFAAGEVIERLNQRLPRVESVEFDPPTTVTPEVVRRGQRVTVTYTVRRNLTCEAEYVDRFHSYELQAIDPALTTPPRPVARSAITLDFRPWSRVLVIPETIPLGRWSLTPEIVPLGECAGHPLIYPPRADFKVVE